MADKDSVTIPFNNIGRYRVVPETPTSDKPYPARLTLKEVTILQMLADGLNWNNVMVELSMSKQSVAQHLRRARDKTGMDSTMLAVIWALRNKVIS